MRSMITPGALALFRLIGCALALCAASSALHAQTAVAVDTACDTGAYHGRLYGTASPNIACWGTRMSQRTDIPFPATIGIATTTKGRPAADNDPAHLQFAQLLVQGRTMRDQHQQENIVTFNCLIASGVGPIDATDGDFSEKVCLYLPNLVAPGAGPAWTMNPTITVLENSGDRVAFLSEKDFTNFRCPSDPLGNGCGQMTVEWSNLVGYPITMVENHSGCPNNSYCTGGPGALTAQLSADSKLVPFTRAQATDGKPHVVSVGEKLEGRGIRPNTYIVAIDGDARAYNRISGTLTLNQEPAISAPSVLLTHRGFNAYLGLNFNGGSDGSYIRDCTICEGSGSQDVIRLYATHQFAINATPGSFRDGGAAIFTADGQNLACLGGDTNRPDYCLRRSGETLSYMVGASPALQIVSGGPNGVRVSAGSAGSGPVIAPVASTERNIPLTLHANGSANLVFSNERGSCSFAPGVGATGFSCSSDERLKDNIADTGPALPRLASMPVRDYTVRATGERMTGVIAQEMQRSHPDMVHEAEDGTLAVESPSPWIVVKAIQELKAENDSLRMQLAVAEIIGGLGLIAALLWPRRMALRSGSA